jgi:hypothetical protein
VLRASSHRSEYANVERRLRAIEQQLERFGHVAARASSSGATGLMQAADRVSDLIAAAFGDVSDRLRGSARTVGGEASRVGQEAARLGGDAVQRLSREVSERPLVILAVAIGIGVLVGMAGRRR